MDLESLSNSLELAFLSCKEQFLSPAWVPQNPMKSGGRDHFLLRLEKGEPRWVWYDDCLVELVRSEIYAV